MPTVSFVRVVTQRTVRTANTVSLRNLSRPATHRRKHLTMSHYRSSHQSFAPITRRPKSSCTPLSASRSSSNRPAIPDPATMASPGRGPSPGPGPSPSHGPSHGLSPDCSLVLLVTSTHPRCLSPLLVRPRDCHSHRLCLFPRSLPGPQDTQRHLKRHRRRGRIHR